MRRFRVVGLDPEYGKEKSTMPLRFARKAIVLLVLLGTTAPFARGDPGAATPGQRQEHFIYPMHAAESLIDVSRIFGVSVEELVQLNHIDDPNRIEVGKMLQIPNVFAREIGALRSERDRLLDLKRSAESESAERRQAAARLETELRQIGARNATLERELERAVRWERRATLLALALLALLVWALKSRFDRALMARRLRAVAVENSALRITKEKLGEAAVQHELRLQNLYGHGREPASSAVAEGRERLRRAFDEGVAEIEALLEELRREQEGRRNPFKKAVRALSRLLHPVRELLDRHRPKYHAS